MNKRYQGFVSSTLKDLKPERQRVQQALLALDCFPAGMELFSAAVEDQWTCIKQVIDESDFYIVIIAGRYGTTLNNGTSYTEHEYKYAVDKGIPILAFIHGDPGKITSENSEPDPEKQVRLEKFRELVKTGRLCSMWNTPSELTEAVMISVFRLKNDNSMIGWSRADRIASDEATTELHNLRKEKDKLKEMYRNAINAPPEGSEKYAHGDEAYHIEVVYEIRNHEENARDPSFDRISVRIKPTWDELFAAVAGTLFASTDIEAIRREIDAFVNKSARVLMEESLRRRIGDWKIYGGPFIDRDHITTIITQFEAQGLIDSASLTLTDRGRLARRNLFAISTGQTNGKPE